MAVPGAIVRVAMAVPFGCTTTGPAVFAAAPPTDIPGPKFAVVPTGKTVFEPVIVTCTTAPWAPVVGASENDGGPRISTVRLLLLVIPGPETVSVYSPGAALG